MLKSQKTGFFADKNLHPVSLHRLIQQVYDILLLTERINSLSGHFKAHKKDHNSRRGLLSLVGRRRRLLDYIKKKDVKKYEALLDKLSLRK